MNNLHLITQDELITSPKQLKPHVVILGAGASIAATLPDGDKNGKHLPDMDNFIDVLGLRKLLIKEGVNLIDSNFENIYSNLYLKDPKSELINKLEEAVYDYFLSLELPNEPTVYDHLVLSLRKKDAIFTFNWDPFLFDAWARNHEDFSLPSIFHLHGNVRVGYCEFDNVWGRNGSTCPECGKEYISSKLLYPIGKKDYNEDKQIKLEWKDFEYLLSNAFTMTIFGYGAPITDTEAVKAMKMAWKRKSQREIESIEFIDIKSRQDLYDQWNDFIFSHHYRVCSNFYTSIIARYPRRTCEAIYWPTLYGKPVEDFPLSCELDFDELYKWYFEISKYE